MTTNLNLHHHVWLPHEGARHTVVALHGTGGDENDLVPLVRGIYPEANILGLRGNVSENGYARFFKRYAEGMFDEADIRARANDLAAFWDAAVDAYGINPGAVTWLGYSNGANMIAALLLLDSVVRDAVLLRAQSVFSKPETGAGGGGTVKLLSGEYDSIVPIAEAKKLRDALAEQGYGVEYILLATGHQLSGMDREALARG